MAGKSQTMRVIPGSIAFQAYGNETIVEKFQCNFGLNEKYRDDLNDGNLRFSGFDMEGNARIFELPRQRFFMATLFLPQVSSKLKRPHPLILAFVASAIKYGFK